VPTPVVSDIRGPFADHLAAVIPPEETLVDPEHAVLEGGAEIVVSFARTQSRERFASLLGPNTRWVHVMSTGVDGCALDVVPDGVVVTCSRGASADAISEWVFAMLLAHAKRLPDTWIDRPPEHWGFASLASLDGASVGLVGLGAIATAVHRRLAGFDVQVLATRRRPVPAPDPTIEMVDSVAALLARVDHAVIAAPATPATRHIVDARALASARPGLHLVNVARGSLIDQDALVDALDDGRVARASLDVVDPEPLPDGHPLYAHPRVFVSAHVSWSSPVTLRRTVECFGENLARYRAGRPLEGVVDLAAGY